MRGKGGAPGGGSPMPRTAAVGSIPEGKTMEHLPAAPGMSPSPPGVAMPKERPSAVAAGAGSGGSAKETPTMARLRLMKGLKRVHESVRVKRKYLIQDEESKEAIASTKRTLKEKGFLAASRLDVTKVARLALEKKRQHEASNCILRYNQLCGRFKDMVTNASWFKNFVTIAIFIAGINVGAQTYDLPPDTANFFGLLDDIVLGVFVAECVLNIFAEGTSPWRYFFDPWNVFDFLVVVASFLPFGSGQIAILRLMRLLRLLKLVRALPKLRILVIGLLMSFQSIGYVMLMVFLLFYLWAVVGVIFLAKNDPVNFGNLHLAFLALWRSATGDDWTDMMYTAFYGCTSNIYGGGADYAGRESLCGQEHDAMGLIFPTAYFIVFQVIASMMLINMFIGAILMSVEEAKEDISNVEVMTVTIGRAKNLRKVMRVGLTGLAQASDPFVKVTLGNVIRATGVKRGTQDPEWNQTLEFPHFQHIKASELHLEVYDWDRFGRDVLIGFVVLNTAHIAFNKSVRFHAYLTDSNGVEYDGQLYFDIRKDVTDAVPTEAYDPDSKIQTIANRLLMAKSELQSLHHDMEKRKKRRAAVGKVSLLQRMKSMRSMRSIRSLASFGSRSSRNSDKKTRNPLKGLLTPSAGKLKSNTLVEQATPTEQIHTGRSHPPVEVVGVRASPADASVHLLSHANSATALLSGKDRTPSMNDTIRSR